ncbi:MAG: DNA gyrase subunit A [Actinobacteria bacterium]|uniref:DNA topoisomerase (ATP-hydrolyzing) n=1 Tax=freshwater metagenome TaxID=449393 RepID=A0A6J6S200_9ZZZZ|nr:DNA gyrase subunit A [Actinomycetota bacterium]
MSDDTPVDGTVPGTTFGRIEPIEIQQEMEQSFLDYAISVIVGRALPDARDGLKPVHRRILWAMHEAGLRPDRNHRKCATVVGDVLGKYHPHGDQSVYDALVRMGQDFSLRHPLIDPHGNFGSPSDPPAAYRYTECRLTPLAMHMLAGIDENTVDFSPNFDGSTEEPNVLPGRFPNLLVNGSQGIAVGMATNIPPHNLGEVIDATLHLIDHPDATPDDLMEFVKGPDFPTGAQIMGRAGLISAIRTGRGSIKMRAKAEIEEGPKGDRIVVTEIPYQTSVETIEEKIAELANARVIEGVREIRNERSRGVTRLVIELKRDTPANVLLNNLYKHTPLQTTFATNFVALVDGVPRTLNLREALVHYIDHQVEVITRRTQFRLDKAQRRAHIVEGFLKALDLIDQIIATIRASADRSAAILALQGEGFEFSEIQATEIVDMRLSTLTRLGRERLEEEMATLRETIQFLQNILADDTVLRQVIKDEMTEIRDEFATPRKTTLEHDDGDLEIEDLIDDEEVVVVMTARGYVKTVSADTFRTQARGGRGVAGARLKDEDYITDLIFTSAHAFLLFFSNKGKVYRLKAHRIPMRDRTAQGLAIVNLLQLDQDEKIQTIIDTRDYESHRYLMFVTRNGTVKKTMFNAYDSSRQAGLIAINLREGDELVRVMPTSEEDEIMVISESGQGIRFSESDIRPTGRTASGVRGMRLKANDAVVGADSIAARAVSNNEETDQESPVSVEKLRLLTITDGGYGKRTEIEEFNTQRRGGQGVRAHKMHAARGKVVTGFLVGDDDHLLMINDGGVVIRTKVSSISVQGRTASGVRVMNLDGDSKVAAVARVLTGPDTEEAEDAEQTEETGDIDAGQSDLA